MKNSLKLLTLLALCCSSTLLKAQTISADGQRWFKIEISIFSNEAIADREEETWSPHNLDLSYPNGLRRLEELQDLLVLDSLLLPDSSSETTQDTTDLAPRFLNEEEIEQRQAAAQQQLFADQILAVGPTPKKAATEFQFFDLERDSYLKLPDSLSDFQQTNRALERSPDHRLLYHGIWRQPVMDIDSAEPIFIQGGDIYGEHHELEGSVIIRFNDGADRVVIDTRLWLSEFRVNNAENEVEDDWAIPQVPSSVVRNSPQESTLPEQQQEKLEYSPQHVFLLQQSREMRSAEFHYLDHPALGLVIQVGPYEVPELPQPGFQRETNISGSDY